MAEKIVRIYKELSLPGESVYEYLLRQGYCLETACGGYGYCGKCFLRVLEGRTTAAGEREKKLLKERRLAAGFRLACYLPVADDLTVELPNQDFKDIKPEAQVVNECPAAEKKFDNIDPIEQLVPWWDKAESPLGLALDIGTTTVVLYLLDLHRGNVLATRSFLNPQKTYGADVLSRINYCNIDDSHMAHMKNLLINEINLNIEEALREAGAIKERIARVVAAGNTVMLHIFLGASTQGFTGVPYKPVFLTGQKCLAAELNIHTNAQAVVRTLPCVSAFAGADLTAAMEGCGLFTSRNSQLLVDIGTNGEMVLSADNKFTACSTAAGPAFEGGQITWGIGAVAGAIDHVKFGNKLEVTTIGGIKPKGICGSGLIDAVAGLLNQGLLTPEGLLLSIKSGERFFLLDPVSGIGICQKDIRELQLAKAAIYSGIECLQKAVGIDWQKIDKVYLAGGFGTHINLPNALRIGLFPAELKDKIVIAGNAAIRGACLGLLSEKLCNKLDKTVGEGNITYIDLALSEEFTNKFLKSINFPAM